MNQMHENQQEQDVVLKKGALSMVAEIDYDQFVTPENVEILYNFTGERDLDKLMEKHMRDLVGKLEEILKSTPNVRFEIQGSFNPIGQPVVETQGIEESETIEVENDSVIEGEIIEEYDIPAQEEQYNEEAEEAEKVELSNEKLLEDLELTLEKVSIEKGMPQRIIFSPVMNEAIKQSAFDKVETENSQITKYNGFPVQVEGMEELYIVECKLYLNNEVEAYARSIKEVAYGI